MARPWLRVLLLLLAVPLVAFWPAFTEHFLGHFTGSVTAISRQWHIAALNIVFFLAFLVPLSFRRKASWKEKGLVTAFFVSLFVEMYGLAFSMIFASSYLFPGTGYAPKEVAGLWFLGVYFSMTIGMVYGLALMAVGTALIALGWVTLYRKSKKGGLVTTGIYAWSRHPQYLGFILVLLGWFVSWPTILTAVFTPILVYKYLEVSSREEKEIKDPGYSAYKKKAPFMA
jgi:protein-S-isoprenylcysteine O-methyltransferase Ste14